MGKGLLQKTFHAESPEDIDLKVNEFGKTHNIKATLTNVNYVPKDSSFIELRALYDYIVFYEPGKSNKESKEEMMNCPGCGTKIPSHFEFHMKCNWRKDE